MPSPTKRLQKTKTNENKTNYNSKFEEWIEAVKATQPIEMDKTQVFLNKHTIDTYTYR